ncbi:SIMPL domain-containing protein [Clostridium aestuarii]|uniref:SIMPL domain-containing protein n=1 Tax=Clostridium aestuarii TaxID=338193 RepID=A0ABT4CWW3_9CLOT|nr:SIMPL domain-containing protein [Clostridium aestuarii]MCY6483327.1 SIMPL domain-containing protein [Clostridium aestuarii]
MMIRGIGGVPQSYCPYKDIVRLYNKRENYIMQVEGEGRITVKSDIAIVYLSILTENKNLEVAQKENAVKTNNVINGLKDIGINKEDIETVSYNIKKTYDYIEGKQEFRTYEVKNSLKVTVKDLDMVGEVIDTAVENGANVIDKIVFTISNPELYYRKALKVAVENAIKKSMDIARTMKVAIDKIPIKIKEQDYPETLKLEYSAYDGVATTAKTTPIQAKELEIRAKVEVIFGYK